MKRITYQDMVAEISPWQEDGWVTMRLAKPEAVAAN
mgnify:CR=1 FL=1